MVIFIVAVAFVFSAVALIVLWHKSSCVVCEEDSDQHLSIRFQREIEDMIGGIAEAIATDSATTSVTRRRFRHFKRIARKSLEADPDLLSQQDAARLCYRLRMLWEDLDSLVATIEEEKKQRDELCAAVFLGPHTVSQSRNSEKFDPSHN